MLSLSLLLFPIHAQAIPVELGTFTDAKAGSEGWAFDGDQFGQAIALLEGATEVDDGFTVTITDGQENQSREFRRSDILAMVDERRTRGWDFVFLSADLGAFGERAFEDHRHNLVAELAVDDGVQEVVGRHGRPSDRCHQRPAPLEVSQCVCQHGEWDEPVGEAVIGATFL